MRMLAVQRGQEQLSDPVAGHAATGHRRRQKAEFTRCLRALHHRGVETRDGIGPFRIARGQKTRRHMPHAHENGERLLKVPRADRCDPRVGDQIAQSLWPADEGVQNEPISVRVKRDLADGRGNASKERRRGASSKRSARRAICPRPRPPRA